MASYSHTCTECGASVRVPDRYVGRTLWCTSCGRRFVAGASASRERVRLHACDSCNAQMRVPARLAGKTLSCPQCGAKFIAKAPPKQSGSGSVLDRSVQDPARIGLYLTLPWLLGAVAVFVLVWAAVPLLVGPRIVVISLATLVVAAVVTMRDAEHIAHVTGEEVAGLSGVIWAAGVMLLAPLAAPLYAFKRGEIQGFSAHGIGVVLSVAAFAFMLLMTWAGVAGG